jgi:hypothetical protein
MDQINIPGKAIFVKLNEYKDILDLLDALKDKLDQSKSTLDKIKSLKTEEETELELWENSINEIDSKLIHINKTMYERDPQV